MALPEKRTAFGRCAALDFLRSRCRKGALILVRSCRERLVNFRVYVNLGYTLCRRTDHMVSKEAFLRSMVDAAREICWRIVGKWEADRSGGMKAPSTRVGWLSGIGVIGMIVSSLAYACKEADGVVSV